MAVASKNKHRQISLRWLFLISMMGLTVIFWLISIGVIFRVVWKETNEAYDYNLRESAHLLFHMARNQDDYSPRMRGDDDDDDVTDKLEAKRHYYQVIRDGEVVMYSRRGSRTPFVKDFDDKRGYRNVMVDEKEWRVYVVRSRGGHLEVQVAQSIEQRQKLLWEMIEDLSGYAIVLLVVLALISGLTVYVLLKPLLRIAKIVSEKSPNNLSLIHDTFRGSELNAIVVSINGLLNSLDHALVTERQFTANAAHELRTHLTRLDMKVQLLQRKEPSMKLALSDIREEIKRYTHMVSNLLMLARLDPIDGQIEKNIAFKEVEVAQVIEHTLKQLEVALADKKMKVSLHLANEAIVLYSSEELLGIMVHNILDNALKYCPVGTPIDVSLEEDEEQVVLTIADHGKGVSDEVLLQLNKRFYRVLGTQVSGSGLGLSIVNEVARVLGAQVKVLSGRDYSGMKYLFIFKK